MTVRELIQKLGEYDPDAVVVVDGYEEGYDDPSVFVTDIVLDTNWREGKKHTPWSGRHEYFSEIEGNGPAVKAVVVGR